MTNKNNLQEKIAELTAKHEHEEYVNNLLPNYKTLAILHWNKKRIVVQNANKDTFMDVLSKLPPTNKNQIIGNDKKVISTPFRVDIENPCAPGQYNKFETHISYISGDIEVEIELPIEEINAFVRKESRNITDSEYHYFTGISHAELRRMQVCAYSFNKDQISWYGGNKTLVDESEINSIINSLMNNNQP